MGRIYIDTDELHGLARELRADAGALGDINRDLVGSWARTPPPPVELVALGARSAWVQGRVALTGAQLMADAAGLDVQAWATDAEEGVGSVVGKLLGVGAWTLRQVKGWPRFLRANALNLVDELLKELHTVRDLDSHRREGLLLLGLGEATIGRLSHFATGRWPAVFWRGNGRVGGLMSSKALNRFPWVSVALDGLEAAVAYQKAGGATGIDFWKPAVSGGGTIGAFAVGATMGAGGIAATAFGAGMMIGEGINKGSEVLTGESVSDRWGDWAIGGKLDDINKRGDQLTAIRPNMSKAEIQRRAEELNKLSQQSHELAEKTKNPVTAALMMVGIGR